VSVTHWPSKFNVSHWRLKSAKIINSLITIGFLIGAQQTYATDKYDEPELSWGVGLVMISGN
jgi:hypothetical protein